MSSRRTITFRSVAQLADRVRAWAPELPADLDLVVGIPRSGMLAATMLAAYRNLPLATLNGFVEGELVGKGVTRPLASQVTEGDLHATPLRVLVLDDSALSGETMRQAREQIAAAGLPHDVLFGAVYGNPRGEDGADLVAERVAVPRVFEWNVLHHTHALPHFAVSLEGVLSDERASSYGPGSDGRPREPRLLLRPTGEIGWIVSSRPEHRRAETERWLAHHEVAYRELVMLADHGDPEAVGTSVGAAHKAAVYRRTDAVLFVDSDVGQAVQIAELSGRPVLSTDVMRMVNQGADPFTLPTGSGSLPLRERLARRAPDWLRRVLAVLRGRPWRPVAGSVRSAAT